MDDEEKLRLAVITGAADALKKKENHRQLNAEEILNKVSNDMHKILAKAGITNSSEHRPFSVAVISGASKALDYSERNQASEKETLKYISGEMDNIISNIDK